MILYIPKLAHDMFFNFAGPYKRVAERMAGTFRKYGRKWPGRKWSRKSCPDLRFLVFKKKAH